MISKERRTGRRTATAAACFLLATGFGLRQARERDLDWVAPPEAASRRNPLENQPSAEAGGRKLFEQRCAACHGDDGKGTNKAPDLTEPDVQKQSDGALFWKIAHGNTRRGMPTFSYLPEPQRWQVILRLRTLAAEAAKQ